MRRASAAHTFRAATSLLAVCLCLLCAGSSPADDSADATALIIKLGDPQFAIREQAESDLIALGAKATAALQEGVRSPDLEVSRRSRRIVRSVLEQDFFTRLQRFENGDQQESSLPGWQRFADVVGTDAVSRGLYVPMLRLEPGLFLAAETTGEELQSALQHRIQQFMVAQNTPDPARRAVPAPIAVLAMLFHATDPRIVGSFPVNEQSYLRSWLYRQELQNFVKSAPMNRPASKILMEWIHAGTISRLQPLDRFSEAIAFEMPDALPLAVELLQSQKVTPTTIEVVARLGGKDYVESLLPALKDETKVVTFQMNNKQLTIETRDVALASIVYLTGQDLKDYFFASRPDWYNQGKRPLSPSFNISNYRFNSDEDRPKAHQKLADWLKTHRINPSPVPMPELRRRTIVIPASVPKPAAAPVEKTPDDDENKSLGLNFADSFELQRLNRARQMIRDERFAEAAILLADMVRQANEKWFQPQRGVPQFRELRGEAERLISTLPPAGFAAIEQQFGAVAQQMLGAARSSGSTAGLLEVSKAYFSTKAGAEATYLLGVMDLDAGHLLAAAMHFERLATSSHERADYEPQLSLKRALCWSRLGEARQAKRALDELNRAYPGQAAASETFRLRGHSGSEKEQAEDWLNAWGKPSSTLLNGWLTHRGQSDRNAESPCVIPWLEGTPIAPVMTHPSLETVIKEMAREVSTNRMGRLPSFHPLIVGETIVMRTMTELRAVNANGDLLWASPQEDTLWHLLQPSRDAQRNSQQAVLSDFVRDRLWDDSTYGTISSDGRLIFVVEGDRFDPTPEYQRFTVGPDGHLRVALPLNDRVSALVAYNLKTGKVVWESGQSLASEETRQQAVRYIGAPLSIGGVLFAVTVQGDEVVLRELESETGTVRRQWPLQTEIQPAANNLVWGLRNNRSRSSEHPAASSPSYVAGMVVCRTPGNRIVAVDLTSGSLRWAYQTPRPEVAAGLQFNPGIRLNVDAQRRASVDRWVDAALVVAEGRVLAALPDTNLLTCIDLESGAVCWTNPRFDGLYVQGVQDGKVLVVGRTGLRAYQLADGSPAWATDQVDWPSAAVPSGMGVLMSGRCVTPLSSGEIVAIETSTGRVITRSRSNSGLVPGNLVASVDRVYSLGLDGLRKLQPVSTIVEQLAKSSVDSKAVALRLDYAHALQSAGRVADAVDELLTAMKLEGTDGSQSKQRLASLLTEVSNLSAADRERVFKLLDPQTFSADQRLQISLRTALAYERENQYATSIDRFVAFHQTFQSHPTFASPLHLQRESAAWSVRLDRWTQSKLAVLPARLKADERAAYDARLQDFRKSETPDDFLACYGNSELARAARKEFAQSLLDNDRFAEAELQLRTGVDTSRSDRQTELLLALLKTVGPVAGRRGEHWLRQLQERSSGDDLEDGGRSLQMLAASLKNSNRRIGGTEAAAWPALKPRQQTEPGKAPTQVEGSSYDWFVPVLRQQSDIDAPYWIGCEQGKRKWHLLDEFGRSRGELTGDATLNSSSFRQGVVQARQLGPALFLWTGTSVHAFELGGTENKSLWSIQLNDNNSQTWQSRIAARRVNRMQVVFVGRGGSRQDNRWWPLIVQPSYVCYQRGRELQAVEPLTGQLLWKRDDDSALDCDLVGDESIACAIDAETGTARILDAVDGRLLGRRQLPPRNQWLAFAGRHLILQDETTHEIRSIDLKSDQESWKIAQSGRTWQIDETNLAMLDGQGHFSVVDLRNGRETFNAQVELATQKLEDMVVLEAFDRYLVFASLPSDQQMGFMQVYRGQVVVNGPCFAINRRTGKTDWTRTLSDQVVTIARPNNLPAMTAFRSVQEQAPAANGQGFALTAKLYLQVLNTRSGALEVEETGTGFFQPPSMVLNPTKHTIEFRYANKSLKLNFSED